MLKNIATTAILLTAALATGCQSAAEIECATAEECGLMWSNSSLSIPPQADPATEVTAAAVDGSLVRITVAHPADCAAPEAVLHVDGIGRSLPPTALGALDLHARCAPETTDGRELHQPNGFSGDVRLSDLTLDLAEALPPGVCVGSLVLSTPSIDEGDAPPFHLVMAEETCGSSPMELASAPTRD